MSKELKVFWHHYLTDALPREQVKILSDKFKMFINTGELVEDFGKDSEYTYPPSVKMSGLRHIHLRDSTSSKDFNRIKILRYRTSNTALVYCAGYSNPNHYLLIAVIDGAHERCREQHTLLLEYASVADKFQNKH
ncbi:type II toxin-antitoxin system YafO family toxin [Algicola sagamiensis]|uniref:type II toxin-antitoxin system YafO family toxin n=1 Tax=Algicola sagamiensis TaxID=163869 RepID=UPI00036EFDDC|nr:type II toxin-antitoxin system YafO family toxin [Algicola sagamiensis]